MDGIKENNIEEIKTAGANIFVVGTAIVESDNMEETIETLRNQEGKKGLELKGQVSAIIYSNEINSYTVAKLMNEDFRRNNNSWISPICKPRRQHNCIWRICKT